MDRNLPRLNPFPEKILEQIPTPCFVIDLKALERNMLVLDDIQKQSGCKILLALKGYATHCTFPLMSQYLAGTTASSVYEARLGQETFGKEVHIYSPAYSDHDIDQLLPIADHIVFNSFHQWHRHRDKVANAGRKIEIGIRFNPQYSEVHIPQYDPCAPASRFGMTAHQFKDVDLTGLDGLHFHSLCQQFFGALERTLNHIEERFAPYLEQVKWVNFGGGHYLSHPEYESEYLIERIIEFQDKYKVQVYLEPGEGIVMNTGYLVSTVLDIMHNLHDIAIVDTSATAHMPDIIEMPYTPDIIDSHQAGAANHFYRIGSQTCLSGDIIGEYSFDQPLKIGQKLVFADMAQYTMVKTTNFNGIPLPSIATYDPEKEELNIVKKFGYDDFKNRLS